MSAYHSFSRRVDPKLQLTNESHRSDGGRSWQEDAGGFKPKTTIESGIGAGRGALLDGESFRKKVQSQEPCRRNHNREGAASRGYARAGAVRGDCVYSGEGKIRNYAVMGCFGLARKRACG